MKTTWVIVLLTRSLWWYVITNSLSMIQTHFFRVVVELVKVRLPLDLVCNLLNNHFLVYLKICLLCPTAFLKHIVVFFLLTFISSKSFSCGLRSHYWRLLQKTSKNRWRNCCPWSFRYRWTRRVCFFLLTCFYSLVFHSFLSHTNPISLLGAYYEPIFLPIPFLGANSISHL